jgi:hypothetical protein
MFLLCKSYFFLIIGFIGIPISLLTSSRTPRKVIINVYKGGLELFLVEDPESFFRLRI